MSSDWDDDTPVGYRHPPRWTQFRKGQSGNPRGRPKKPATPPASECDSAADDALRAELARKITVTDGNGTRQVPMHKVIARAQATSAAKGNPHAQRDIIKRQYELERRDAARQEAEVQRQALAREAAEQRFSAILAWKKDREKVWQNAALLGQEPDEPWPHPDDILVNHAQKRFRVRGPCDQTDILYFEYLRAERDAHFTRALVGLRSRKKSQRFLSKVCGALWVSFDVRLPRRWQVSHDFELSMMFFMMMPLKDLHELLRRYSERAAMLRPLVLPQADSKEAYQYANTAMKPLLQHYGYRSLAEFERAYEVTRGNPPWPAR